MKRFKRKIAAALSVALCIAMITGCGDNKSTESSDSADKKELRIGASPVSTKIIESAVPDLEKMGYKVKVETFDDFVLPNTALTEGSLDANIYQHKPYLDEYNKKNGTDLVMIDKIAFSPMGLYSQKIANIADIPEKASVGIYQDASNQDRALRVLQDNGVIKLKKKEGLCSILDIEENPKDLQFKTMDINQLIKGINDLDLVFTTTVNMFMSGTKPKYELALEKIDENSLVYATGLVVKKENENAKWVKDIVKAYESKDTQKRDEEVFGGSFNIVIDFGK